MQPFRNAILLGHSRLRIHSQALSFRLAINQSKLTASPVPTLLGFLGRKIRLRLAIVHNRRLTLVFKQMLGPIHTDALSAGGLGRHFDAPRPSPQNDEPTSGRDTAVGDRLTDIHLLWFKPGALAFGD